MSSYSRLNPPVGANNLQADTSYNGNIPLDNREGTPLVSEESSEKPLDSEKRPGRKSWMRRTSSAFSAPKAPWHHGLSEKHLRKAPSTTDTVRYFDRRRQMRRVVIDCLIMWSGTLIVCAALFGVIYGFSTISNGLTQTQKYAYNALVTGLSIVLGLAFAAQFKQYAEMMRWRFLTAQYRSPQQFEEILDCDSYRSTLRIIFTHWPQGKGRFYPSKAQLMALMWFIVFVAFNVFAALVGLTYSIDVSDTYVHISPGNISIADLKYISLTDQPNNGQDYDVTYQQSAANLYGQLGQTFQWYTDTLDSSLSYSGGAIYVNAAGDLAWNRFVDLSPTNNQVNVVSSRTVTSNATCKELTITYGGYAGFNTNNQTFQNYLEYTDENGNDVGFDVQPASTGETTWIGNVTSAGLTCGERCVTVLALQSANNVTVENAQPGVKAVPKPRLWTCNNTVSQVNNFTTAYEGFDDPQKASLPDLQALILGGAIGWTGITSYFDDGSHSDLQFASYNGDTVFNPPGNVTHADMEWLMMKFTVGAIAAMDTYNAPRLTLTGTSSPSPAQVVNVKWPFCGAILAGIPVLQLLMMFGVAWFSSKAVILEPSYLTIAHLMNPMIDKMGNDGVLLSADELAERVGENYKVAYGIRPNVEDPGHHDDTFVRKLDLVEESEGYGKLTRGRMPQGRYD